ncbi:MAG TPA: phosphoribosyltransferase family protein [Vicinamibacteria bacterium]|nr:phosphoribosyltransferase family protein [Vicinamibacteria bacterium]
MTTEGELTVLFDEGAIRSRVHELGRTITEDFSEGNIACVGVLPNSLVFMADLIRHIRRSLTCDFLKVDTQSPRRVDIAFGSASDFGGRDVLLIQGVVDTGVTLSFIRGQIEETWRPRTLRVAALINRENHRKVDSPVDYVCFELTEEGFAAGYGLGFNEHFRGTPFLGMMRQSR